MRAYGSVVLFMLAGAGFGLFLLGIGRAFSPHLNTWPAKIPFESGRLPAVHAWSRFHVRFLNYALIFLLFDMEMVFMYPWAAVFLQEGWKALMEMGMFILILVLGILYAWRERAFEWD